MTIKILKKIVLVVSTSLAVQIACGMSQERDWKFVPTDEPVQIPLPHLREQREAGFRGNWEFRPHANDAYQTLPAQTQSHPNSVIRQMMKRFAEELGRAAQQSTTSTSSTSSSSSSSSSKPLSSKRMREKEEDESQQEHRPAKFSKSELTTQEIQELLKNALTISVAQFTEENLKARRRLNKVGILIISPGNVACPVNLIMLIERYFPNVLNLRLNGLVIGNAGFKALAESDIAGQLKRLDVGQCGIMVQEFTSENLNRFKNLVDLAVNSNQLGDAGFKALAESNVATQLKRLNVVVLCSITAQEFTTENLNRFKNLEELRVDGNQVGDIGFKALVESNIAAQLKVLSFTGCGMRAQVFTSKNLNKFKNLVDLAVNGSQLGNIGFKALVESNIAVQLKRLSITSCGIMAQEFTNENFNRFNNLVDLAVNISKLGDKGFRALAESNIAAQLKKVCVNWCGITTQEFTSKNLNKFKNLVQLEVGANGNQLSENFILVTIRQSNILYQTLQKITGVTSEMANKFNNELKNVCPMKSR